MNTIGIARDMQMPDGVVFRRTADLCLTRTTPALHSPDQVKQIAASKQEFGFTNPVLISVDNDIIAGHGRVAR
jgi:ParB-like chromosome segregation protein Spo0J